MKTTASTHRALAAIFWAVLLLSSFGASAQAFITSYTLVNADTDLDITALSPGATLDLATLPTRNLNIRANTSPAVVGSVVLSLSGTQARTETENVVPYALFSDLLGDYFPWTPAVGAYTLVATPYSGPDGTGAGGSPLALQFTVVNTAGQVAGYTLVNADTDLDLLALTPGITLDLAALPTRRLNIRAGTAPAAVGSVVFVLSGAASHAAAENVAPYALFSDLLGDYFAWTPAAGTYTLTATPYSEPGGNGAAGTPLTLLFRVRDDRPLPVQLAAFEATAREAGKVVLQWTTASEVNNDRFEVQRSADGRLYAAVGAVVGVGTAAGPHFYTYHDHPLPATATWFYYRLRQVDTNGASAFSPVRAVLVPPQTTAFQVFPTLASDGYVHYAFGGPVRGGETVELLTALGQGRGRFLVGAGGAGTVPVAGLPAGTYLLRLEGAGRRYAARFVCP